MTSPRSKFLPRSELLLFGDLNALRKARKCAWVTERKHGAHWKMHVTT
jgi:hypothetical protein